MTDDSENATKNENATAAAATAAATHVDHANIPSYCTERDHWLFWNASADAPRKPLETPYADYGASWTDPDAWLSYDEARAQYEADDTGDVGLGFVFAAGLDGADGACGALDLDGCIERTDDGRVRPKDWLPSLSPFIERGAYMELSPSGTGIHIPVRGLDLPDWWSDEHFSAEEHEGVEAYERKFFTVTGRTAPLEATGLDVGDSPVEYGDWLDEWLREASKAITGTDPVADATAPPADATAPGRGGTTDTLAAADVVSSSIPRGEYTSHPVHGSSTGTNFKLDADGETFRCWRHDTTGNGLHLLGVEAGIIECGEWDHGGLDAGTWREICDYAREQGYDLPDPDGGDRGDGGRERFAQLADGGATTATADAATPQPPADSDTPDWVADYIAAVEYAEDHGDGLSQKQKRARAAELLADRREYIARWPENDPDKVPLWEYNPETGIFERGAVGRIEAELTELGEALDFGDADRRAVVKNVRRRSFTDPETFDAGEYDDSLVALGNGVYNVEQDEFYDHAPEYRLRSALPFDYDPDAECPNIDAFLTKVTDGDDVAKQTLYEWVGYCLVDGYPIHAFLLLHGDGGNGKGTFLNLLETFLGAENVSNVGLSKITSDDRFALAQLDGKLANMDRDIPGRSITTEQLSALKKLAAGEPKQAEHKHEDPFTLENSAKLAFAANEPPRFYEASDSVARRLLDIEFPVPIAGTEDEKSEAWLRETLMNDEELAGLFNKATAAVRDALDRNAFTLQAETDQTDRFADYMADADPIVATANECLEERPGHVMTKDAFYALHVQHAQAAGHEPAAPGVFFKQFEKKTGMTFESKRLRVNGDPTRLVFGVWPTREGEQYLATEHVEATVAAMEDKRDENARAAYELRARHRDRERTRDDDDDGHDHDGDAETAADGGPTATLAPADLHPEVVRYVRDQQDDPEHADGVPHDDVVAHLTAQGATPEQAATAIEKALSEGRLTEPTNDCYLT